MPSKVVNAGIGYTIGNYLIKGLVFLTLPIFTRIMDPSDFGLYNIFIASEGILYVLIGLAIHTTYKNAFYKFGANNSDGVNYEDYVASTIVMITISAVIWALVFLLFSAQIGSFLLLDRISLFLLVAYSTSMAIMACYNAHLGIQYKYKEFIKVSGLNAICNVSLSIILILTVFNDNRYIGRILGTTLPAVCIVSVISYKLYKKSSGRIPSGALKWGVKYSLPIVPNGIGQVILSQFDRMMINKMISTYTAGIYSFAYNIFGLVNVTALSLDNAWSPWLYEKMNKAEYDKIQNKSAVYVMLIFLFSAAIMLICPELIMILGTTDYYESIYSAIPLIAGGFFLFLSSLPISVEYYYEKTKMIAVATFLAAIVKIILNLFFLREYGYLSAGFTTLATYILYFIFHYYTAYRIHGSSVFDAKRILRCSGLTILIMFFSYYTVDYWLLRWVMAALFMYFIIIFEEQKIGIIKKVIKKWK